MMQLPEKATSIANLQEIPFYFGVVVRNAFELRARARYKVFELFDE